MRVPYQIAIPSYKRPETIRTKTLKMLRLYGVDFNKITIFVSDEDEKKAYRESLSNLIYEAITIKIAVPGIRDVRNYIENYYEPGTYVFSIDDDITELVYKKKKNLIEPISSIDNLVSTGFIRCVELGTKIWGIYPVPNPWFMQRSERLGLCYIVGCAFGFIASRDSEVLGKYELKDDFERSLRYYKRDLNLFRFEWVAPKTNYYKEPGGIQCYRTYEGELEAAKQLCEEFPDWATLNLSKKSGWPEVRLYDRIRHAFTTPHNSQKRKEPECYRDGPDAARRRPAGDGPDQEGAHSGGAA